MMRFRSVFAVLMIVLSLGLHVDGPHGHHCILEEAACGACRTAVAPVTAATPAAHAVTVVVQTESAPAPQAGPVVRSLLGVLTAAPLRAPPSSVELA